MNRTILRSCATLFFFILTNTASASVCTDSPTALNRMSTTAGIGARAVVQDGDFSALMWVQPAELTQPVLGLFEIENALQVHVLGGQAKGIRATLLGGGGAELQAAASIDLQPGEWALIGISFRSADGVLDVWAVSQSQALSHASDSLPGFGISAGVGNPAIGAFDDSPAMAGVYGLTALRSHALTEQDVLDVWNSRLHYAPYDLINLETGGSMNGASGCVYMFNHAMTTKPINHSAGAEHDIAAIVGEPSSRWNFHIFDAIGAGSGSLRVVRELSVAQGFVNCSVYDAPGDFFLRPMPTISNPLPEPHYVAGEAPLLRQIAKGPSGLLRVMTSANSRAVQASDGSADGSANYAHGFIELNLEKTAGILNVAARIANDAPWFGFDMAEHAPYFAGNVATIAPHNFSRFWSSSYNSDSKGPGNGVRLLPGPGESTYALRCRPDGMIDPAQPLIVVAYLLKFPGASDVYWVPNMHLRQGEPGTDVGEPATLALDTQTFSHTLQEGDAVPTNSRIVLVGDYRAIVNINDAVQTGSCISLVEAVSYDAELNATRIDFEHPFTVTPQVGEVLRFGSWGYEAVQYKWPGVESAGEEVWRGLRFWVEAEGDGQGAVLFAFSAWRPNVDGFVFGTAGWSGNGYWRQIDRAFSKGIEPWMEMLAPDVWLQMFAQQGSSPSTINAYKMRIRNALPNVEIAWMGDCEHEGDGISESWQHYILSNAAAEDVIAITLALDDRVGSYNALLDDGLRSDRHHLSARGNTRLAEVWTEMLLQAAIDSSAVPGDLTGDGSVGVPDLLILLGAWGPCADCGACSADLNEDCNVGVSDLLILLGNWG